MQSLRKGTAPPAPTLHGRRKTADPQRETQVLDLVTPGHQTEGLGPAEAPELRIAEDSDFRVF